MRSTGDDVVAKFCTRADVISLELLDDVCVHVCLVGMVVAALFAAYGFLYGFLKSDDVVAEGAGARAPLQGQHR